MVAFFALPGTAQTIQNFVMKMRTFQTKEVDSTSGPNPLPYLDTFFAVLLQNTTIFDTHCRINISLIGEQLLNRLANFGTPLESTREHLLEIFALAYRLLLELEFSQTGDLSFELASIKRWVDTELNNFPEPTKSHLVWAHYLMPAVIAKELIHHPNLEAVGQLSETLTRAQNMREKWDEELEAKSKVVSTLRDNLVRYETSYNFVGLVDAFRQMLTQKHKEKNFSFGSLIALGILIIAPLISEVVLAILNLEKLELIKQAALVLFPATLAIELLMFYFFRVVLLHFRTVKAHILQLELRAALCQFIENYSTYASSMKKNDAASLDRFEALVFSGIISSEERLPSALDGADQLTKLIKSFRAP
jgi:hypothetical protein